MKARCDVSTNFVYNLIANLEDNKLAQWNTTLFEFVGRLWENSKFVSKQLEKVGKS